MKDFIFLTSGESPDFGVFRRGQIKKFSPKAVEVHVARATMKAVEDLENDELIYWLMDRGINPPDKAVKSDLQKYLITGKNPRGKKKNTEEVKGDG